MLKRNRKITGGIFSGLGLSVLIVISLWPIVWMILSSLKPNKEFFSFPVKYLPSFWTLEHYARIFSESNFLKALTNSFIVSFFTVIVSLILSIPAGYAFARFKFPGRNALLIGMLALQFVPSIVLIVPFFIMIVKLRLIDSLMSVIITYPAFTVPFCIWLLTGFFSAIPKELEEAAKVDGCNLRQSLLKVIIPVAIPGIVSAGLYSFIWAWQEYLLAMVFLSQNNIQTAPVALTFFMGEMTTDWTGLMAAAVLMSIPVFPFMYFARFYQQGIAASGIKG